MRTHRVPAAVSDTKRSLSKRLGLDACCNGLFNGPPPQKRNSSIEYIKVTAMIPI